MNEESSSNTESQEGINVMDDVDAHQLMEGDIDELSQEDLDFEMEGMDYNQMEHTNMD
jgi:hypothetical protein